MKGFIKCYFVFLLFVAVLLAGVFSDSVSAQDKLWTNGSAIKVSEEVTTSSGGYLESCPGTRSPITVKGWSGLREACIYGSIGGMRFAQYQASGANLYAVAFSLEDSFTQFRAPCTYTSRCVYGQAGDALIVPIQGQYGFETVLVKNVSKRLELHTDEGLYYTLSLTATDPYISLGSRHAVTGAMTVSSNGEWGLVEIRSYGFVRINLRTGEYRRVVAPGGSYGYGFDPSYELALSSDGSKLAIVGWNTGVAIYEVDNECGDILTDASQAYFSAYVYACPPGRIDVYQLFPGFRTASSPKFTANGENLVLYVSANQQTYLTTIAHSSYLKTSGEAYVALGDSYTSGEGETNDGFYIAGTNTGTNRCHVSARSYPLLIGVEWGISTVNKACSGGRVADVQSVGASLGVNGGQPTLVSVSVGGNDIGLMGKLSSCLTLVTCEWATGTNRAASANEIRSFFPKIVDLLTNLQQSYPASKLAIIGYPSVVNTSAGSTCGLLISTLLDEDERRYMDESIRYLNKVLKAAASYTKVGYIDIEDALVGERLCDASSVAMNTVRVGDDIAPITVLPKLKIIGAESFHPTPRGHQLVAAKIHRQYNTWQEIGCDHCGFDAASLEPSGYWADTGGGASSISQRSGVFLASNKLRVGGSTSVALQPGSLKPGSKATVEVHSEPQKLAELSAASDGSLEASIHLPGGLEGYHTVHIYGTSPSGEEQDLYQVVAIGDTTEVPLASAMVGYGGGEGTATGEAAPLTSTARSVSKSTISDLEAAIRVPQLEVLGVARVEGLARDESPEGDAATSVRTAGVVTNNWTVLCVYGAVLVVFGVCVVYTYYVYRRYRGE